MLNEAAIFRKYYVTDRKYLDLGGMICKENVRTCRFVNTIENYPQSLYSENPALQIVCAPCGTEAPKKLELPVEKTDVGKYDVFCFAFNSRGASDRLRLTFRSAAGEEKSMLLSLISERWTYRLTDISGLGFRSPLVSVVWEFFGKNAGRNTADIFQLDEVFLGNILDFDFSKGAFQRYFRPENAVFRGDNSLAYFYKKGEALTFPTLENPRYSVLNMPLLVKDSIALVAKAETSAEEPQLFDVYFSTDLHKDFDEERKIAVSFTRTKECKLLNLVRFRTQENERLYRLKIVPRSEEGLLTLYKVSFEQEEDILDDAEAAGFLARLNRTAEAYQSEPSSAKKQNVYNVKDFGAAGNGADDDTGAIQSAVDRAQANGGGKVILSEGRFSVTHIRLKSNVTLEIAKGALLLQSSVAKDYPYEVRYGHDNIEATVSWPHNFLVHNLPLLYAAESENIRVCGEGKIRMCDEGNENRAAGFPFWPIHCEGIVHVLPVAFDHCRNVEISGVTINRASSYHCFFVGCENIFVDGVKFFDVRCLSADGIGLFGCKHVRISNSLIVTNDDGVTLCSVYYDPRSGGWWHCVKGADNGVKDVEIARSYINSAYGGAGKAIAFIPWGSDAPDLEKQVIDGVYVHDCILNGGYAVGTWCDNPYYGKQPFDNTETDDYSPVMNVKIIDNVYKSGLELLSVRATDVLCDGGLRSSASVVNGDFRDGKSNWNCKGNVAVKRGVCTVERGSIEQELFVPEGRYEITIETFGEGTLFVNEKNVPLSSDGKTVSEVCVEPASPLRIALKMETKGEIYSVAMTKKA